MTAPDPNLVERRVTTRIGEHVMIHRPTRADEGVLRQVFDRRQYVAPKRHQALIEAAFHRLVVSGARPLIIDGGANIGASAVWFACEFPGAHVVAIEPDPGNAEILCRNIAGLDCTVLRGALDGADGTLVLQDPGRGAWGYVTAPTGAGLVVRAVSLDALVERKRAEGFTPFIAKLDIEGAEHRLFEAESGWLDLFPVVCIETHDWMLPGKASSAGFLRAHLRTRRDLLINGENLISIDCAILG